MNVESINLNKLIENEKGESMEKRGNIEGLCFECKKEGFDKFWEPRLEGNKLSMSFGKIGTKGRQRLKEFSASELAEKEFRKVVCEKLAEGYIPTDQTISAVLDQAKPQNPEALAIFFESEYMSDEEADDFYRWLTACVQFGMSSSQFKKAWRKIEESDEDAIRGLESDFNEMTKMYEMAVQKGADRFAWFNDNAVINMVALRGDPGAKAIENLVTDIDVNKFDWPEEFGPNKPIKSLGVPSYRGSLRTGEKIHLVEKAIEKDNTPEMSTVIQSELEKPEDIFKDLNKEMKKRGSGGAKFLLDKLIANLSGTNEPARQVFVTKLAGLLAWPEEKFYLIDSVKFKILRYLARFGGESEVEAIEKYGESGEEYKKEAARRTIEVIRYAEGREHHPNFNSIDRYINCYIT